MLRALACAAPDARIRLVHDGAEVGVHRGRIVVHGSPPPPFALPWTGERELHLPHGTLAFVPAVGDGLSLAGVAGRSLVVRSRRGGERIVLARGQPRRPLKHLLQEAKVPPWQRAGLPLVFDGETLVAVPGVGIAPEFQAHAHDDAVRLDWRPRDGR
jgi:tRNA(Ile)-lysidine synthase